MALKPPPKAPPKKSQGSPGPGSPAGGSPKPATPVGSTAAPPMKKAPPLAAKPGAPAPKPGAPAAKPGGPPVSTRPGVPPSGTKPGAPPAAARPGFKPAAKPGMPPSAARPSTAPGPARAPGFGQAKGAGAPAAEPTPAPKAAAVTIEERALAAVPQIAEVKPSPMFHDFLKEVVPRLRLAQTSRGILEAFANIDVTSDKVAAILRANPYYEMQFMRVLESLGKKREEMPRLEGAVVLLGMQNSRNLVIALQALRNVRGTHPEWSKDGKLKIQPQEVLHYALKTEEALAGRKGAYSDTAYAAGLVFDYLTLITEQVSRDSRKVAAYIDVLYTHGLKSAQIGAELSKGLQDFGYSKYAYSACLLHDVGKAIMAILDPAYLAFVDDCTKRALSRRVRIFAETRRWGVNHAMLGGLACEYFQFFRPISKAILYHHDPYLVRGGKAGLGQLASLVCLATNIANNFKKTEKADDPVIQLWKTLELRDFKVGVREMLNAVAKSV